MGLRGADIKEMLIKENFDFKRLFSEHQSFEKRLDQLQGRSYLTSEEEREMTELKKKKLILKDQMQIFIEQYRARSS